MYFTTLIYFILFFFITITEGGKKSSTDKIIIHVPYKIHKHHHTHTKYKIITIPARKKENTVIYLKEEIQPIIKHVPPVQTHIDVTETHPKTPEPFIPPHQESASALLKDMANHKEESLTETDQQHQYSTIIDDQKPLESHVGQTSEDFVPSFTFKPMILPSHENLIPNFSFKPVFYPPQHSFNPKLLMKPMIHQSYDLFPKYTYQPMFHQMQGHFNPKFTFRPKLPSQDLQDSVAHTSNQIHKTVISPKPKTITPYKVKEETLEDHNLLINKHRQTKLNRIPVPSTKFNRKGKSYLNPMVHNQFKSTKSFIQPPNSDYEYEHIGYLIIDGNSRKMVGKNFKDEIHLSR